MTTRKPHTAANIVRRPVAMAIALALTISAPATFSSDNPTNGTTGARPVFHTGVFDLQPAGSSLAVSNCDDSGPGSLRDTVAAAVSGDTVDLSGLTCSTITLTGGAIAVAQASLTIAGPGAQVLAIDGNAADRVFTHTGTGDLTLSGVSVQRGRVIRGPSDDWAIGGCVESAGRVALDQTNVIDCMAEGHSGAFGGCISAQGASLVDSRLEACRAQVPETSIYSAYGGALFVEGDSSAVDVVRSTITGSSVIAQQNTAHGGGICNRGLGSTHIEDSTLSDNLATGAPYVGGGGYFSISQGIGGAVFAAAPITVSGSTLSGNKATSGGAIASFDWQSNPSSLTLINSTISGNEAASHGGGIWSFTGGVDISNSTITLNRGEYGAGGVMAKHWIAEGMGSDEIRISGTVVAGNSTYAGAVDIDAFLDGLVVVGSGNLVDDSSASLPEGTLSGPAMLGPLADNGGWTWTHAPLPGSPLIDAGNNLLTLTFDQRGVGFARTVGAATDIGSVEYFDKTDIIFRSGFEQVAP